jgi:hypothetical protein
MNTQFRRCGFWIICSLQLWLLGCTTLQADISPSKVISSCEGTPLIAEVVAFEQAIVVNRFGAFMPGGMLYALKRDVVRMDDNKPLIDIPESEWPQLAGRVKLRDTKRPRPLVLRVNERQCIDVRLHNLMTPDVTASKESDAMLKVLATWLSPIPPCFHCRTVRRGGNWSKFQMTSLMRHAPVLCRFM